MSMDAATNASLCGFHKNKMELVGVQVVDIVILCFDGIFAIVFISYLALIGSNQSMTFNGF